MYPNFDPQLAALQQLPGAALRARYLELFGEPPRSANKAWLVKRIGWRLQALAEGDLSERARQRAAELANDADLRLCRPRPLKDQAAASLNVKVPDSRLPPAGNLLIRVYKSKTLQVRVLLQGFEYEGACYPTLSAVARAITGQHCNGFQFFRLGTQKGVTS